MARLYLVRHALVAPRADVPAPEWELTRAGRATGLHVALYLGYGFDEWRALRLPDVVEVA
jgi:hypothetical protein